MGLIVIKHTLESLGLINGIQIHYYNPHILKLRQNETSQKLITSLVSFCKYLDDYHDRMNLTQTQSRLSLDNTS